jgi:hypothetical protein
MEQNKTTMIVALRDSCNRLAEEHAKRLFLSSTAVNEFCLTQETTRTSWLRTQKRLIGFSSSIVQNPYACS